MGSKFVFHDTIFPGSPKPRKSWDKFILKHDFQEYMHLIRQSLEQKKKENCVKKCLVMRDIESQLIRFSVIAVVVVVDDD
ncbi:Hypothetical predicted protein [Octopus vulgaris]|uniref:Uncharacterized protein n=1 Tax=Octopus vulgaris TaxID=6645 RepID=A0AA36AYG3_OCTVU|nr:Hypothetical predicted protein [Octopus vulgaris]